MKYHAIIFDLDGTLIDSMQLWREVDTEFLGSRGIAVPTDLFEDMPHGNSFIQTASYFKTRFELPDSVASIMQEWTDMVGQHYSSTVKLKPGARELLDYIRAEGLPLGLGTSNSRELAEKALSQHGIWTYFSSVVTGDMHLKGKPFPDIYLQSAQQLNTAPENCLVIEDTLTGVQAAKAAGMTVWAIHDADSEPFRKQIIDLADKHYMNYIDMLADLKNSLQTPESLVTRHSSLVT